MMEIMQKRTIQSGTEECMKALKVLTPVEVSGFIHRNLLTGDPIGIRLEFSWPIAHSLGTPLV